MLLVLAAGLSPPGLIVPRVVAQQPELRFIRCEGTLQALAPAAFQMETAAGEKWLVKIEGNPPDISFRAAAVPEFLQPGMLVQFRALLNKRGNSLNPITELKVLSIRQGVAVGLRSDGGIGGGELFADSAEKEPGKKKSGKREGRPTDDGSPYLVTGLLRRHADRQITVAVGATQVKGQLSDRCPIAVDVANLAWAQVGDHVEIVDGWWRDGQPNQMFSRKLVVTTERTLGVEEPRQRSGKGDKKSRAEAAASPKPREG